MRIIRGVETPITRAASMNEVSRSASTWPRMIRAPCAQDTTPIMTIMRDQAGSDACTRRRSAAGSIGKLSTMSTRRISAPSTRPPA